MWVRAWVDMWVGGRGVDEQAGTGVRGQAQHATHGR